MPGEGWSGTTKPRRSSCGLRLGGASNRHRTGTDRLVLVVVTRQNIRHGVQDQIHPSSTRLRLRIQPSSELRILHGPWESTICAREAGTILSIRSAPRLAEETARSGPGYGLHVAATNLARCEGVSGLAVRLHTPLYFTVRNSGVWPVATVSGGLAGRGTCHVTDSEYLGL
ncbi:hypothetical protein C2845_PM08G29760 [Panicum miliaceum]|uniref:Uncharacterized protein n=1 Tax=Panicum miliaceum TaxID=4540 RepID=A0A3L6QZA4_PANMI|nr:hypothetical protein C2845_PM08G29760 [Panicum miliaceum]